MRETACALKLIKARLEKESERKLIAVQFPLMSMLINARLEKESERKIIAVQFPLMSKRMMQLRSGLFASKELVANLLLQVISDEY